MRIRAYTFTIQGEHINPATGHWERSPGFTTFGGNEEGWSKATAHRDKLNARADYRNVDIVMYLNAEAMVVDSFDQVTAHANAEWYRWPGTGTHIVIDGDLETGIEAVHGPFADEEEAIDWAETRRYLGSWRVTILT